MKARNRRKKKLISSSPQHCLRVAGCNTNLPSIEGQWLAVTIIKIPPTLVTCLFTFPGQTLSPVEPGLEFNYCFPCQFQLHIVGGHIRMLPMYWNSIWTGHSWYLISYPKLVFWCGCFLLIKRSLKTNGALVQILNLFSRHSQIERKNVEQTTVIQLKLD